MPAEHAELYRMVMPEHLCPFGIKSRDLLRRKHIAFEDHHLKTQEATRAFMAQHGVKTTPQTFIDGVRIGGYEELRKYFGLAAEGQNSTTYAPVLAVFATALLMSAGLVWNVEGTLASATVLQWFIAISMCGLAMQKLRDLAAFTNQFVTYDLLPMRVVRYAYVYPFVEAYAGIGMLAALPALVVAPLAIFIGTEGAVSVIKAVYVDKRELKCACVGGDSKVPLGLVSLTENVFMVVSGIWMLAG